MKSDIEKPILSLCIPTNGIVEWVIPVIESIYNQNCDEKLYEVVITDNGSNQQLEEEIQKYKIAHKNLIYKKTNSVMFQNQIDCFKLANGEFVKFINHRSIIDNNAINIFIKYAQKYRNTKPIIYFLNKSIECVNNDKLLSFDEFMNELSYYSSWSGGISCWREDFDDIFIKTEYDKYFPHLDILLAHKNNRKYIICNEKLMFDQKCDVSKKGKYDLFDAFAVHYLDIIRSLQEGGYISNDTFCKIKEQNLRFVIGLHFEYLVRKVQCSYYLNNFCESFFKYYSLTDFIAEYFLLFIRLFKHFIRRVNKFFIN